MNVNSNATSATPTASGRFGRNALLAGIAGGAVLGAAVVGGLWVGSDSRDAGTPDEAAAVQQSIEPAAAPLAINPTLKSPDAVWVYIVGSEAEAADLRRAAASVPGSPSQVIVMGSRAEATFAANLYRSLNQIQAQAGQPQVEVRVLGSLANAQ